MEKTGIFYVGSGIALLSALVTLLFLPNIKHDNMIDEDRLFREYLVEHGIDITNMGINKQSSNAYSHEEGEKRATKEDVRVIDAA